MLTFITFSTQASFDRVFIYSDLAKTNQIAVYSGQPATPFDVVSTTNEMHVRFTSNSMIQEAGFKATFVSQSK